MATVLIVDDAPDTRLFVKIVLEHAGHKVVEAADGEAGLAEAERVRPQLIMVDLSLPLMSGAQFVRAVRNRKEIGRTKLALYTATRMSAALRDMMQMYDISCAIPKPSEPKELLSAVEQALRK